MATINELTGLSVPTGSENVVIQNGNGNYKMSFKPVLSWAGDTGVAAGANVPTVVGALLDKIRLAYGDLEGYHVNAYGNVPNWVNGITASIDVVKAGNYVEWFGVMFSQGGGVYAFSRWDTIGGASGTVRVSELGNSLA